MDFALSFGAGAVGTTIFFLTTLDAGAGGASSLQEINPIMPMINIILKIIATRLVMVTVTYFLAWALGWPLGVSGAVSINLYVTA